MDNQKFVFFSALPPFRGGISQFSNRLLLELKKKYKIVSYTFKSQYPNWLFPGKTQFSSNEKEKVEHHRIVSTFNLLSYFKSIRIIKKEKPSVFIINYWMTFMSPLYVFWAKRLPKNTLKVAIIHNLFPHEPRFFDSYFNRMFLKRYDLFIALSAKVESDIKMINPNANVYTIPHPVYDHFEEPIEQNSARQILQIDKEKHTLLFFGIIRDYKGLDVLIQAFSKLPSNFQLIIAGEVYGSDEEYTLLIQRSQNENIHFFNEFIPDEKVHLFFSAADLCVLPYRSGTQSGVKAIADKMLIPTLVSNVGGIGEKIQNGINGYVISKPSPISLKNKIIEIFDNPDRNKVKEVLGQNDVSKEDSWSTFLIKFDEKIKLNQID